MRLMIGDVKYMDDMIMFETREEAEEFVKEVRGIEGLEEIAVKEEITPGETYGYISLRKMRDAQTGIIASWDTPSIWNDKVCNFKNIRTIEIDISRVID